MVNFGIIKSQVSQLLGEHYVNNNNESAETVFKSYMKTIQASPVLMLEYIVFKNLERKGLNRDTAYKYVDENIALFNKFPRTHILKENEKLAPFKQNLYTSLEDKILSEGIQNLILDSAQHKGFKNVNRLHESLELVLESVTTTVEVKREGSEPLLESTRFKQLFTMAVSKFNGKYAHLNESERNIFQVLTEPSEAKQQQLFESLKRKTLKVITEKTQDVLMRREAIRVINGKSFNTSTLADDVVGMYELSLM